MDFNVETRDKNSFQLFVLFVKSDFIVEFTSENLNYCGARTWVAMGQYRCSKRRARHHDIKHVCFDVSKKR
jgi:hypothetical protein